MKKLEKYTGEKTYMFPNGTVADPNTILINYPAVNIFTHIVETDQNGEVMFAIQNLSAMRSMYNIDTVLTEDEAIAAIEVIINTVPKQEPSSNERLAAAMEFQNLLNM